jgi:hypothetical protein
LRANLIAAQFSIVVLVKFLQRRGRVRDLGCVYLAITVRVQRRNDR